MVRNLFLAVLMMLCACSAPSVSEYERISGQDAVDIHINSIVCDTIAVDAANTSYSGHWAMVDSTVYFIDDHIACIRRFPAGSASQLGSAAMFSSFDSSDRTFFLIDGKGWLSKVDLDFKRTYSSNMSWHAALPALEENGEDDLLDNPNPEAPAMYEHNTACSRLYSYGSKAVLPIVARQVYYNGYSVGSNARDFWEHSYILLSCNLWNISKTAKLLGHYPPVYQTGNFPIFSSYDYIVADDCILVSFAADSRIYVLDMDGHPLRAFGHAAEGVSGNYPQTEDIAEYEREYDHQRKKYGYYGRLFKDGSFLFRTYHTDNDQWRMQVYNNEVLWGDLEVKYPVEIFGVCNECYYAYAYTDYANEQFKLIKFKLEKF